VPDVKCQTQGFKTNTKLVSFIFQIKIDTIAQISQTGLLNMKTTDHLSAGIHAVTELLKHAPSSISQCIILKNPPNARLRHLMQCAQAHQIPIAHIIPPEYAEKISNMHHQGIIALHQPIQSPQDTLDIWIKQWGEDLRLLVLDGVQDPRNLGACIRTACAAACHAMVIPKHRSSAVNETVIKVACGACSIIPIFQVTNIAQTLNLLKKSGIWCWGFSEHAEHSLHDMSFSGPIALVFGNEATGLRTLTQTRCDGLIRIPTQPNFPSLNLSVSVGVALFEMNRQINSLIPPPSDI
jgi:23S rRNA (guanosine2251-2'-O)-methyltransferase